MSNQYGLTVSFDTLSRSEVSTLSEEIGDSPDLEGFNEYGVRENHNEEGELRSIDVLYRAMEPGRRNWLNITGSFLRRTASYEYDGLPFQMDHSTSQMADVGDVTNVWFSDGALYTMGTVPNTGNERRSNVIADFTHEPPAIEDGSVSFKDSTLEISLPAGYESVAEWQMDHPPSQWEDMDRSEFPTARDGRLLEFSLTPFPGGYGGSGGLSPAFSDLASADADAVQTAAPSEGARESQRDQPGGQSRLRKKPLRRRR